MHGIGGAGSGLLSTNINDPITISFFIPTDPTRKAITTMVSLRTDRWGEQRQISLVAYDEKDVTLATLTAVDYNGSLLSITHQGIHKVSFFGTTCCGGAGVDDLFFAPLSPVASTNPLNVPGPLPVLGALSAWHASRKLRHAARAAEHGNRCRGSFLSDAALTAPGIWGCPKFSCQSLRQASTSAARYHSRLDQCLSRLAWFLSPPERQRSRAASSCFRAAACAACRRDPDDS